MRSRVERLRRNDKNYTNLVDLERNSPPETPTPPPSPADNDNKQAALAAAVSQDDMLHNIAARMRFTSPLNAINFASRFNTASVPSIVNAVQSAAPLNTNNGSSRRSASPVLQEEGCSPSFTARITTSREQQAQAVKVRG